MSEYTVGLVLENRLRRLFCHCSSPTIALPAMLDLFLQTNPAAIFNLLDREIVLYGKLHLLIWTHFRAPATRQP